MYKIFLISLIYNYLIKQKKSSFQPLFYGKTNIKSQDALGQLIDRADVVITMYSHLLEVCWLRYGESDGY
jgi:hypothetical protein